MSPSRRQLLAASGTGTLAALAGCLSFDSPSATGTWPRRGYDSQHRNHASIDGPVTNLHTHWTIDRPRYGGSDTSPVVRDGTVYTVYSREARENAGGSWLEAIDAGTGQTQWTTELWRSDESYDFYHSDSLVLDGDSVFVQTHDGLKRVTTGGTIEWTFQNLGPEQVLPDVCPPVVTDDVILTGSYASRTDDVEVLYALNPDGTERWRQAFTSLSGMWQLSASDDTVYVPFVHDEGLVALSVANGAERWRLDASIAGPVTLVDETLYVPIDRGEDQEFLLAVDATDGTERWRVPIGGRHGDAGLAAANGRLYYAAGTSVHARSLDTGEHVWSTNLGPNAAVGYGAEPVVSGGVVYVPGTFNEEGKAVHGRLFTLDSANGEEFGRVPLGKNVNPRATVAVTDGLAFVQTNTGTLHAVGSCGTSLAGECLRWGN